VEPRRLGTQGLIVSTQGLGCMGMSDAYGPADEAESIATIHWALDLGVNLLDTSDAYGPYTDEELVGKAIRSRRHEVNVATKLGFVRGSDCSLDGIDGSPAHVPEACDGSPRRPGFDQIDLYYQHRVDPNAPIEGTVGAVAELVHQGKVRHLGLCGAAPQTIRRAHAVHPITAMQAEYSLWSRDAEDEPLPSVRELASASSRTARSVAASSPASCAASRICRRTICVAIGQGSRAKTFKRIWRWWIA
jgi:aryl-alcohol dehydrogenase-like predicted oxidoreductase